MVDIITNVCIYVMQGGAMFRRSILYQFEKWKTGSHRKPLLLRGARQTGKTSAVRLFAGDLPGYMELNLEAPGEKSVFERKLPARDLLSAIRLSKGITAPLSESLLFIDEIQACSSALQYLRLLYEEVPELPVIASGSLFEVYLSGSGIEFPVGRVEHCFMHPVTFREYLQAFKRYDMLEELDKIPLQDYAFPSIYGEFVRYTLLGGMPEIVQALLEGNEPDSLEGIYSSLFISFLDDIPKYAPNRTMAEILRHCLETVPAQTGKRITFAGFGGSGYRSREVSQAMKTLQRALLVHLVYPTGEVEPPPVTNKRKSPKLFFIDSGLLASTLNVQWREMGTEDLNTSFRGVLAEQAVAQSLLSIHNHTIPRLQFWARNKRGSSAEVDFMVQHSGKLIPVEVKSGSAGRLRSLHRFMDECDHDVAIRFYGGPVRVDSLNTPSGKKFRLMSLPHFLAENVYSYIEWLVQTQSG